ncbi:MAG: ECF transporter S component [Chloroflexia bacterium]
MKITTRQIVVTAALSAIAILLGATRLGFIPFVLGIAITIMHVPAIIGAVLEGPVVGTIIGFLFGLFSLIWAYVAPTGAGDVYFQNPLISIVPRLFIGLLAYLAYRALRRAGVPWVLFLAGLSLGLGAAFCYQWGQVNMPAALISAGVILGAVAAFTYLGVRQQPDMIAVAVAAIVGTLTNTVLVLGMLGLLSTLNWVSPPLPWEVLLAVGLTNGIPEIVAAVLITVAVVAAWKQIEFGRRGARIMRET